MKKELVLGYRSELYNSILYRSGEENKKNIFYCAGHNIMNIELSNSKQKSVNIHPGMEGVLGITGMSLSLSQKFIAVAYMTEKVPLVTVYEIDPKRERRNTDRPERAEKFTVVKHLVSSDLKRNYYTVIAFSVHIEKFLFTVCADNTVLLWQFEKNKQPKILAMIGIEEKLSLIKEMRFNPQDSNMFTFLGERMITLLEQKEGVLTKKEANRKVITSFAGTQTTHAYFVDKNNETKIFVCSSTCEVLIFDKNCEQKSLVRIFFPDKFKNMEGLLINTLFEQNKKLFAGCSNGTILLINSVQNKEAPLEVMKGWQVELANNGNIKEIAQQPNSEGHFIVGTDNNQLLSLVLDTKDKNNDDLKKEQLISENPNGGILDVDVCLFKRQVAVASEDNIVRLYSLNSLEIRGEPIIKEVFSDTPVSVAFHPSGINIIVAFKNQLKLFNIFRDKLCVFKEQPNKDVRMVRFSPSGRLFAVSNGNSIRVQDFWSGESQPQWFLKEHNGKIRSFKFQLDDTYLLSSDQLGVVIMWNLFPKTTNVEESKKNFDRVIAEKNQKIDDVEISKDVDTIFTLCNGKTIKLIKERAVKLELESEDAIGKIVIHINQRWFFAGIAEKEKLGSIRVYNYPTNLHDLHDVGLFEDFMAHHKKVNCIKLAENGVDMLSGSEDGSLIFWKVLDLTDPDHPTKARDVGGSQNEMVLMDKEEYETNVKLIQQSEEELNKLKSDTALQMNLLEKKFIEDQDREERKLNDDIADQLKKNRTINDEIDSKNREFQTKKNREIENHREAISQMNEEWKLKIEEEEERIEKLKKDKDDKELRQREEKEERENEHQQNKERINIAFEELKRQKTHELEELKEKIKQVNKSHKDYLEKMEAEQNKGLDQLQTKFKQERKTQQDNLTNSHCLLLLTDDDKRRNELELSNVRVKNEKLTKDMESIMSQIGDLENTIEHIIKDINQREHAIRDKDETIEEEKRKNQELEKFKFVLNYKIEELKRDIDPLENELKQLQTQSVQMQTEINHFNKVNSNLRLIVEDLNMKWEGLNKEKNDLHRAVAEMRNFKERFIDRLNEVYIKVKEKSTVEVSEESGYVSIQFNKKQLKHEIVELQETQVKRKDVSGILETNEQKKRNQRKFLEKSVDGLKNKMKTHRKGMNLENNKIMKENMQLISQINKLRKDLKQIYNENMQMETQGHENWDENPTNLREEVSKFEEAISELKEEEAQLLSQKKQLEERLKN